MAKKTTTTTTSDADGATLELMQKVKEQKADIARAEKPDWKTNRNFTYQEGSSNIIVLHVETDIGKLINIVAFLMERERLYAEAATKLGIEKPPAFKWAGHSAADWTSDVRMRIDKLQINAKREKLEKLEGRLNAIISPELRRQMELEAIKAEMND